MAFRTIISKKQNLKFLYFGDLKNNDKFLKVCKLIIVEKKIPYSSVFQPGFLGTQKFREFLAGFPENAINSTIWSA
jgi:hypothetical protein